MPFKRFGLFQDNVIPGRAVECRSQDSRLRGRGDAPLMQPFFFLLYFGGFCCCFSVDNVLYLVYILREPHSLPSVCHCDSEINGLCINIMFISVQTKFIRRNFITIIKEIIIISMIIGVQLIV